MKNDVFFYTQKKQEINVPLYCPATSLKIYSRPDWIHQKVSDTLTVTFRIIGEKILYSLFEGRADIEGTKHSIALNNRVAEFISSGSGPYTQIKDYAFLKGASLAARRYAVKEMNNNKRRTALIFCNMSPIISTAVSLSRHFNTTGKKVHIAKNYNDAVRQAIKISGQEIQDTEIIPLKLSSYVDGAVRTLSPVDIISNDAFDIQTEGYTNRSVMIDRCILHSVSEGFLKSRHIPLIENMRQRFHLSVADDSKIKYIVVEGGRMKGGSRKARTGYMRSLKKWHQRFPFRMYIVYGASTFMKTALHLASPLMPFKVRIAKDASHAFQLIRDDKAGVSSESESRIIRKKQKQDIITTEDIDKLMSFIGSINWEKEGIDTRFNLDEKHPLYFLAQSVKLIKEELDDLLKERKQLEKQLHQSRKMESIGTMAGGIAHDFNNIFYIIIGNTELALEDTDPESPVYTKLEEIKAASLKGTGIIRQLMNFTRLNEQQMQPVSIVERVKEFLTLLRSTIPATIEIRMHLPDTDATVLANPTNIDQILLNICTNASYAMAEKGGVLKIEIKTMMLQKYRAEKYDLSSGCYVCITVSDTGPGIDAEIIDRIFDPYFTTKEVGKGTGMGLAVVLGIVKGHGGAITVKSGPEKGTVFNILLPVLDDTP